MKLSNPKVQEKFQACGSSTRAAMAKVSLLCIKRTYFVCKQVACDDTTDNLAEIFPDLKNLKNRGERIF
jgi:hypothetical protein